MNKKIKFKLESINTKEFATIDEVSIVDKDIALKTALGIKADTDNYIIGIETKFTFTCGGKPFIILNNECVFLIGEENLESFKNKSDGSYTFPKEFITHLAFHAVGTARGVLHCKTENTNYNKYILHTVNLTEIIKEDLKIDGKS